MKKNVLPGTGLSFYLLVLLLFFLTTACQAGGETDMKDLKHKTVIVKGLIKKEDARFVVGNKIELKDSSFELKEGGGRLIGILWIYPAEMNRIPRLSVIDYAPSDDRVFSVEEYSEAVKLKGKKARIVHQHPISPDISPHIGYFDCSLGQIVVYFKSEKDYVRFGKGGEVTLEGKVSPVYAFSKRPPAEGEKREKALYGFKMVVEKISP